jgi:hypothetical protein
MERDVSTFLGIAQIAAVLAGFAALVSVIANRPDRPSLRRELFQLRGVVGIGVIAVVAALLPIGIHRYGFSESAGWRISSLLFLVGIWVGILGSRSSEYSQRYAFRDGALLSTFFWGVLEPCIQIPLVLGALGFHPSLAPAFYLSGLVLNVCQAAVLFARVVASAVFSSDAAR